MKVRGSCAVAAGLSDCSEWDSASDEHLPAAGPQVSDSEADEELTYCWK